MKKIFGFTLAEVLITLGIIGVISAFTIPNLISTYQKQQTATQLKKIYTTIIQGTKNSEAENGTMINWVAPATDNNTTLSNNWWEQYFIPYANLSTIKKCVDSTFYDCWTAKAKFLDNAEQTFWSDMPAYILNDGSSIKLGGVSKNFAGIWIDLNGLKKPNIIGKDIFQVNIIYKEGKIVFRGYDQPRDTILSDISGACNKATGSNKGTMCGALIMMDGWVISDDYPW